MSTVIDGKKALDLLREAVAERGEDYLYERQAYTSFSGDLVRDDMCLYWHDREAQPGCMVGLALAKAGATPNQLRLLDDAEGGTGAYQLTEVGDLEITKEAVVVFSEAQACQDGGERWGRALWMAERVFSDITSPHAWPAVA